MKRAANQPITESVTIYAGIYYKVWRVRDAMTVIPQHAHEHDHLTAVLRGAVLAWVDGKRKDCVQAPGTIKIAAGAKHFFETLTANTVLACIHNADHLEAGEPAVREEHHLELED